MSAYRFGPFRLDSQRLLLFYEERPLQLGPKVVETLLALVQSAGEVQNKASLLERIWPEGYVEESSLAQNVYVIRKILRAHWHDAIETVPRRGYRFLAPVRVEQTEPSPSRTSPAGKAPFLQWAARFAAAAFVLGLSAGVMRTATLHRNDPPLSAQGARAYAIGRYYWNQRTQNGVRLSLRYFGSVVRSDPQNARGYAALSQAYAIAGDYMYGPLPVAASYSRARLYAQRALHLDPQSGMAHAAQGLVDQLTGARAAAAAQYLRAIRLDPSNPSAHAWYGGALLGEGRLVAAYRELNESAQLDPVSVATLAWLAEAAYFERQYAQAVTYSREAIDLLPRRADAYVSLGLASDALHKYGNAIAAFRTYGTLCRECRADAAALLAHVYAEEHNARMASDELEVALHGRSAPADPEDLATAFVAIGRRSEALSLVRRIARRDPNPLIALDPRMDPVRGDRRFTPYLSS